METVDNTWVMYGVEWDDPECLHTVEEAMAYVNEIGFLPLFRNEIPGFSLEERTCADMWWSGNPAVDPWEWRAIIARSGKMAYGKFFHGKTGFISTLWLPYFVNTRRDGYDFDALWDDQKASLRQKKIMDLFAEELADAEYISADVKMKAGFGKGGEKGFEGTITGLQMMLYLCVRDFRQKINKRGEGYGWPVAVYTTPEHIFGRDMVREAYREEPKVSAQRIATHILDEYPIATPQQIKKVLGIAIEP